jgi:hypothetical protein
MKKRILLPIFLLALLVRLAYGWSSLQAPETALANDSYIYLKLAAELLHGQFPSLFRTPGYPLFLLLTGSFPHGQHLAALLIQLLLDSLTAVLVALIAWRLWTHQLGALLAGALYALSPVAAVLSGFILSETLSVFLVSAAFWLSLGAPARRNTWLQALAWIGATLTRPFCLLLPLITVCFLLLRFWRTGTDWKQRCYSQLAVLLIYACGIGAWIGWNYERAGMAVLSTNPPVSFYIYEIPALRLLEQCGPLGYLKLALLQPKEFDRLGLEQQRGYARELYHYLSPAPQDLWFTMDDPASIRRLSANARQQAQGRLGSLVFIHLTGALQTLRPKWSSASWMTRLLELLRLLPLPLAALVLAWKRQWWLLALFSGWTLYVVLAPGPCAFWRFRSLIEPLISLALAGAFSLLRNTVQVSVQERAWRNYLQMPAPEPGC